MRFDEYLVFFWGSRGIFWEVNCLLFEINQLLVFFVKKIYLVVKHGLDWSVKDRFNHKIQRRDINGGGFSICIDAIIVSILFICGV